MHCCRCVAAAAESHKTKVDIELHNILFSTVHGLLLVHDVNQGEK